MSDKHSQSWWSGRVEAHTTLVRWGHFGKPVLLFPTAGGDAEEVERFHLIETVRPFIDAGLIKVYSVDSLSGRAWLTSEVSRAHCCWLQNQFDAYIVNEVMPAIVADCGGYAQPAMVAGCSLGAFNAVATLCRHPDLFDTAIAMSGTYDLERFTEGFMSEEFYFSSPLHWLPNASDAALQTLRTRFVLMAMAGGRWEDPEETWRMASVLGARGIPNRVDPWGAQYDHDWITWREMFPHYVAEFVAS